MSGPRFRVDYSVLERVLPARRDSTLVGSPVRTRLASVDFYAIALLSVALLSRPAYSQQAVPRDTGNVRAIAAVPLLQARDLLAVAGLAVTVAAVMPADQRIARAF